MLTEQLLTNLFYIGKIKDKYFIFEEALDKGRMIYAAHPDPFHTIEDAHLWLIETARKLTTDKFKVLCVEIEKEYMFIRETEIEKPTDNV
jgi:hypothetical protein